MKQLLIIALMSMLALLAVGCGDDDDTGTNGTPDTDSDSDTDTDSDSDADTDSDSDTDTDSDSDTDADSDSDTDADSDADADQTIGSACQCKGNGCKQPAVNVPIPNGGTIIGCDQVPTDVAGGELVCLRTYEGAFATNTYFANGYCALMATKCEGATLICDNAVFGDFDKLVSCPAGTVLIETGTDVEVELIPGQPLTATIDNKTCVASCSEKSDCRDGETDPALNNKPTQYDCLDKEGVKFCYDPRNLTGEYKATEF